MNALILAAEGFEDLELFYPIMRFQEEDFEIQIASETIEAITGQHGYKVFPDITLADIREPAWDMVIIPSVAHMEKFASLPITKEILRDFMELDRRVICIGNGLQALAMARVLKDRMVTTPKGMKTSLAHSKAILRDEAILFDGNLVSCQSSRFLPELVGQLLASMGVKV